MTSEQTKATPAHHDVTGTDGALTSLTLAPAPDSAWRGGLALFAALAAVAVMFGAGLFG